MGVAKAQQKIIGSRSLAPTPKFPCALLGVAQNQTVPGNRVQGELGFRLDALKLGQAVAPVVFISGQDFGAVNLLGLGPGIPYCNGGQASRISTTFGSLPASIAACR